MSDRDFNRAELREALHDGLLATQISSLAWTEDDARLDALIEFLAEMLHWNRAYNLTAITDPQAGVTHHLLDSLVIQPHLRGDRLVDIGSGAGLPGIPLAIANPQLQITSLDSSGKRIRFQRHILRRLGLSNLHPVHARAQDYQPETPFDTVTARALASLQQLAEWSDHLCAPGARLLAMKGKRPESELAESLPGFDMEAVNRVQVPGSDAERHLILLTRTTDS